MNSKHLSTQEQVAQGINLAILGSLSLIAILDLPSAIAQPAINQPAVKQSTIPNPNNLPSQPPFRDLQEPPPEPALPAQPLPQLPSPTELLPSPIPTPPAQSLPGDIPTTITVNRFEVIGSTVFSPETLAAATAPYTDRPISFAELLQARSAITELYVNSGYVTSGAFIPPQTLEDDTVVIQVIEGQLAEINVTGTQRLNSSYVADRLAIAASPPLNLNRLLEGLQLLQLDPRIQTISAELQSGIRPGTNILQVAVTEADTFNVQIALDNGRSPSVGTFRRQIQINEANLLGIGDEISLAYSNTDGSNGIDASYVIPVNPRNGTVRLAYGTTASEVIDPLFDQLDIEGNSRYYELTFRQPVLQSPTEEIVLGLTASRQESKVGIDVEDGFVPLSPGADAEGRTRITALRFSQQWTQRSSQHVLAVRSQFSLGVDALNATVNENLPDSRFFAWRGQGQWVRLLAPDTLLLLRTDIQLADGALVPLEQFGLGGQQSVRGYRQDALLTDSGILASAELRLPILRASEIDGVLQIIPFIDIGTAWNVGRTDPDPETLVGVGLGMQWQQGDRLTARLDWGIPLVSIDAPKRTWQENGIYFSITYRPF